MPFIIIGIIIVLVLIFGGKAIAKKAGVLAKKIIKIVVIGDLLVHSASECQLSANEPYRNRN